MSATDFYAQQPYNKDAWGQKAYDEFKDLFFFTGMLGQGESAIVEHITDLSKNNKGESGAWLHSIADIHGGGVFGDNTLEGRFRSLDASFIKVNFSQLRNGVVTKGRLSEQKSVIDTRKVFRKKMARWLAETLEEQAILTMSGLSYSLNLDGSARSVPAGQDAWTALEYAADVSAPTANRHVRWDATNGFEAGATASVDTADVVKYEMLPDLAALASTRNLTPLRIGGEEIFVWLVHEDAFAALWKDANFRTAVVGAGQRGSEHPIFKGRGYLTLNGILIKPYKRVFTNKNAAVKWGGGAVEGSRSLLLGAQALAMADLGPVGWEEEFYDLKNRWALGVDKMAGFLKPKFLDSYTNTVEDFGVIAVDHAL